MSNVAQIPSAEERTNKRRLHLREVEQDAQPQTVGATLRAARLARDEDARTVAATLKMRTDQLEAIESGDYARLPGRAYTLGFIRSYARYLELDDNALIQRFKDDEIAAQDVAKPVELVFPEAPEVKHVPNGSILILALVVALVIYAISYLTMPARKSPTVAKASQPTISDVQPAPIDVPSPEDGVTADAPFATPPVEPATTFVAGDKHLPASAMPPVAAPAGPRTAEHDNLDAAAFLTSTSTGSFVAASPSEAVHTGARIVLTALEPTYVRIKDPRLPAGKGIYIDRILKTGESFSAPERSGLLMQTGNAGGLHVAVDGRSAGVMGRRGQVVIRIPVEPAYFLKRVSAPQ